MILDVTLWTLTSLFVVMSLYVQYFIQSFEHVSLVWGSAGVLFLLTLWFTTQGQRFRSYVMNARAELSKVVWPKRQDITMTTIAVGIAVTIFSLLITFLDSMFVKLLAYISG